MLLTLCLLLGCAQPDSLGIYSGRARQLDVRIPRFDAEVVIDGDLSDSTWARAALLTGFSQYAPNDGVSAVDSTQVLLGTFHDGKKALMFAVNPLGVQGDGALIEGANISASGFIGGAVIGREQPDLSPDYVFQSRGRVTPWGYEVEVRIPFKS